MFTQSSAATHGILVSQPVDQKLIDVKVEEKKVIHTTENDFEEKNMDTFQNGNVLICFYCDTMECFSSSSKFFSNCKELHKDLNIFQKCIPH